MTLSPDLFRHPGTILLDTARPDAENRSSLLFTDPVDVLTAHAVADVPAVLRGLDAAAARGLWTAGFVAYEAGRAFEPALEATLPPAAEDGPLAWFGVYRPPRVLDTPAVDGLFDAGDGAYRVEGAAFHPAREDYVAHVEAVRRRIREGDVYQVNYTGRVRFGFEGAAAAFYRDLRCAQRVPYGVFANTGDLCLLGCSPELFFRRDGDRVVTRPMKGTVRRGRTLAEDVALRAWLEADEKSRAENLMIVDLLRNDLARCCRTGSVRVPALFTTERYETVWQLTSTVEGVLRPGVSCEDLFRALFPCGSVTGAPKIRAMQRIAALEAEPRGVYCGTVGYVAPGDRAVFNVAIRTAVLRGGHGVLGTGSGVVWDSDPAAEYEESLLKAHFLTTAGHAPAGDFALIETMCWADGVALLDLHRDRLRESAAYFGFPFDEAAWRAQVERAVAAFAAGTRHRVRTTLDRAGLIAVTTAPLPEEAADLPPLRVTFADVPVDSGDRFRFHKTTRRAVYDEAYRRAGAAGFDEVLFRNERGELTEGSRTNLFIRRGDIWLTPPVACGLLGGVYRRHLLETLPNASECVLRPADLAAADAVYLCNAVWGLRVAEVVPGPAAGAGAAACFECGEVGAGRLDFRRENR